MERDKVKFAFDDYNNFAFKLLPNKPWLIYFFSYKTLVKLTCDNNSNIILLICLCSSLIFFNIDGNVVNHIFNCKINKTNLIYFENSVSFPKVKFFQLNFFLKNIVLV